MLIDEADVYLEIRNTGDLKRNSLVSGMPRLCSPRVGTNSFIAFLRSMEYYRGIMFLTTNRVGQIDDAIMSRVHLVVRYERLTPMARIKIWNQFVEKLMDDSEDFSVDSRATEYVQDYFENIDVDWNGREIRNGKCRPLFLVCQGRLRVSQLSKPLSHLPSTKPKVPTHQ